MIKKRNVSPGIYPGKKKIVVRIQGGLGNQMFQYAYAYALSQKNHVNFLLDISPFERYFGRKNKLSEFAKVPPYAKKSAIPFYERIGAFWRKFFPTRVLRGIFQRLNHYDFREVSKGYDSHFLDIQQGYIVGYFQSDKYFRDYESDIRSLFSFSSHIHQQVKEFIHQHQIDIDEYVAISVRRGDFETETSHYLIPLSFYLDAYKKYFPEKKMLIFSDDIAWCQKNFPNSNALFSDSLDAIGQLCLMSMCKYFILSNSTFSRWGAYLSPYNDKKVVRPLLKFDEEVKGPEYMRDHYPEERIPFPG